MLCGKLNPMENLEQIYDQQVADGHIEYDNAQVKALQKLQDLGESLGTLVPVWQFWRRRSMVRGLYLYGSVGRGKSMLMDLFFKHVQDVSKQRYHFHEFMQMIHGQVKAIMDEDRDGALHPMAMIAARLANKSRLICFDEFHIKDITDAMLLSRLMGFLWEEGVVIVATSNYRPTELYQGGYQRMLVAPFLERLEEVLDLYSLDGEVDYRQLFLAEKQRYFLTADQNARGQMTEIFDHLRQGHVVGELTLTIKKRDWKLPKVAGGVAWFTFDEICGQPLSAADYLALTHCVHTVLVSDIPVLDDESLDRVKRFITLIDVLYDRGTNFAASGAAALLEVYQGTKERTLFERTLSRLTEMVGRP